MKEQQIGKFNLVPDDTPKELRRWVNLQLHKGRSILIGNPDGEQYLALKLIDFQKRTADFVVLEKIEEDERKIEEVNMEEGVSKILKGTNLAIAWNDEGHQNKIRISLSGPRNVDYLRSVVHDRNRMLKGLL